MTWRTDDDPAAARAAAVDRSAVSLRSFATDASNSARVRRPASKSAATPANAARTSSASRSSLRSARRVWRRVGASASIASTDWHDA